MSNNFPTLHWYMKSTESSIKRGEISRKLRDLREVLKVKQIDLIIHSGLSTETVNRIEKGHKPWSIDSEISYLQSLMILANADKGYAARAQKWNLPTITDLKTYIIKNHL